MAIEKFVKREVSLYTGVYITEYLILNAIESINQTAAMTLTGPPHRFPGGDGGSPAGFDSATICVVTVRCSCRESSKRFAGVESVPLN